MFLHLHTYSNNDSTSNTSTSSPPQVNVPITSRPQLCKHLSETTTSVSGATGSRKNNSRNARTKLSPCTIYWSADALGSVGRVTVSFATALGTVVVRERVEAAGPVMPDGCISHFSNSSRLSLLHSRASRTILTCCFIYINNQQPGDL